VHRFVTILEPAVTCTDGRVQPFAASSPNGFGVKKWFIGKVNATSEFGYSGDSHGWGSVPDSGQAAGNATEGRQRPSTRY
jgi:hypothetical protein